MKFLTVVVLGGAVMMGGLAEAQQAPMKGPVATVTPANRVYGDVAFTYSAERAKYSAPSSCGCFWMGGGAMDASLTFYHGLGLAVNITGEQAIGNLPTGQGLNKVSYLAGPRYTYTNKRFMRMHPVSVFGEGLFGKAHGTNSYFPVTGGVVTQQTVFAMQVGGGVDVALYKGFSLRAIEADYVFTEFTNAATNTQKDFRVAAGVSYRFGRR